MSTQLQTTILQKLINSEAFCRKVLPFIKGEYFDSAHRCVYKLALDFIVKYNKLPTKAALQIEFENHAEVTEDLYPHAVRVLESVAENPVVEESWLLDNTEKWCKDRALHIAILESIQIIDGKRKDATREGIPDILQKALAINFDNSVGHDYLGDFAKRYDFYHKVEDKMPFDLEMFNTITKGGVPRKTLNIALAGCVHPDTPVRIRFRKKPIS